MPDPLEFFILPFVLSAGVSLLVLLICWRPWSAKAVRAPWVAPLALAAGIMAPFHQITGAIPPFPPPSAMGWFFYFPLIAAGVGILIKVVAFPRWLQFVVATVTCVVAGMLIFWHPLHDSAAMPTVVLLILILSLAGGAWWWITEQAATKFERGTAPVMMLLLALISGAILVMSASATHGRLSIAFAGALCSLAGVIVLCPELRAEGCGLVLALTVGGLLVAGKYYAELTWANLALLFVAPAAMLFTNLGRTGRKGSLVVLTLVLIPLMVAVSITVHLFLTSISVDESGYRY